MKFANRFDTKRLLVRRAFNGMARAYPRGVIAKLRALAVLATIVVACTTVTSPLPSPTELFTQSPFVSPTATPTPAALHARSVTRVGDAIVASGHFDGSRSTQVAVIRDPSNDLGVQIAVRRGSVEDSSTETEWFKSEPAFLSLPRAKFAVADLDGDGKDDLAALYDAGGFTSRLYVFKSTGSAFTFANAWWSGDDYPWARARAVLGARTGTRDALFVMYQDDGARLRIHQFNSDGTKLAPPVTVFDSGKGQFDIAKARFAVGRFTRARGGGLGRRRARRRTVARAGCGEFASRDGAARERHDVRHGELGSDRAALPDVAAQRTAARRWRPDEASDLREGR